MWNKLQKLDLSVDSPKGGFGTVRRGTVQYIESLLPCLPASLRRVILRFCARSPAFLTVEYRRFWKAFDSTLTSSKFPHLTYVELSWLEDYWERVRPKRKFWQYRPKQKSFVDILYKLSKSGVFENFIPKIYGRGILWCGEVFDVVYPVSKASLALATRDRIAWKDSSRNLPLPRGALTDSDEEESP